MEALQSTTTPSKTTRHWGGTALIALAVAAALGAIYHARRGLTDRAKWIAGGAVASFVTGILVRRSAVADPATPQDNADPGLTPEVTTVPGLTPEVTTVPGLTPEEFDRLNRGDVAGLDRDTLAGQLAILEPELERVPDSPLWSDLLRGYHTLLQTKSTSSIRFSDPTLGIYFAAAHDDRLVSRLKEFEMLRDVRKHLGDAFMGWTGPECRPILHRLFCKKIEAVRSLITCQPVEAIRPYYDFLLLINPNALADFEEMRLSQRELALYFSIFRRIALANLDGDWGTRLRYCIERGPDTTSEPSIPDTDELLCFYVEMRRWEVVSDLQCRPFKEVRVKWGDKLELWRDSIDEVLAKNTRNFHDFVRYHGDGVVFWLGPKSGPALRRKFVRESTRRSTLTKAERRVYRWVLRLDKNHPLVVIEAVCQQPDEDHERRLCHLDGQLASSLREAIAQRREMIQAYGEPDDTYEYASIVSRAHYRFRRTLERLRTLESLKPQVQTDQQ